MGRVKSPPLFCMEKILVLDYETRSEADLKKVGGWEYSVHPTTRIMCAAWRWSTREKLRETPTEIWSPAFEKRPPPQLVQAFKCPNTKIWAHNALFEQCMTNNTFRRLYPGLFDHIPVSRWGCTAALSAASGLPRKLEQVLMARGLPVQKDMVGHKLMLKYCKPRKPTKKNPSEWHSNKDELRRIMEYCKIDVDGAVELILDLPDLSPFERALWELDQEMNQTGFLCDRGLVQKVLALLDHEAETLKLETQEITMGALASALQRDGILNWLEAEGVALPDLKKLTVEEALKNEKIDGDARRILEIRQTVSKTSTKKYQSFLARSESDNRVRDILLFNAAVPTARWGGSGVQVQNFPRGVAGIDADHAVELLQDGDYDTLKLLYGDIFSVAATCLRGMITAPKGYKLVAGDYAQIEARVLFWLAGHDAGVKAFREGRPIYEEQAQVIFSVPNVESVTKQQRQVGKQAVLGCGYGMGAEKFQDTCWVQGQMRIDLDLAKKAVYAYRNTHRPVPKAWESMERAAMLAVQYPDKKFTVNKVTWFKKGKWLYGRLPSGRLMPYYDPSIRIVKKPKRDPGPALCYWGIDSKTKRWQIESTYGGKLVENAVQAIARDIMAAAMLRARAAGFPILFTVHDELVSVRPENDTREKEFEKLMCELPAWAEGIPVKAEVWSDYRYRK